MYFLFDSMDHCQRFTQSLKSLLKSTIVISFGVVIVATFTPFQCSMPNSFQNSFNPWNKQKSAGTRLELYGGWGRFATSNSETMSTVWFSKLSWFDIQLLQIYFRTRGTQFGNRLILHSKTLEWLCPYGINHLRSRIFRTKNTMNIVLISGLLILVLFGRGGSALTL